MLNSKKSLKLIDYQDSYYYRQQRKKRRNTWLKFIMLLLLIIAASVALVPFAYSNQESPKYKHETPSRFIHGPQLLFDHPNPTMRATMPVDIKADIEVNGLVAYAKIKQIFINPHAISLEGKYQFPLPEDAAVKQLLIKVGDKEIIGEVMEKSAAQKVYKKAKAQGRKASLVEQKRPNIFTNKIANIPAQSTIVVTLTLIIPIDFTAGKFNLRLPLAITERYQPSNKIKGELKDTDNQLKQMPYQQIFENKNAQLFSNLNEQIRPVDSNYLAINRPTIAPSQSSINITLNSGIPITDITSESHKLKMRSLNNEQSAYFITLDKARVISNKSFALSWQLLANQHPQISSFTEEVAGEHFTLLTFFPPKYEKKSILARDIIFVIDTSGSMQGSSMVQAKKSLQHAIAQLNLNDSFNIIAFDDNSSFLFPFTQMASTSHKESAQQFIHQLQADGGTQMYRPLSNALMMKRNKQQSDKAIRQIIFITDGAVSNETELMQLLSSAQDNFRLYTIGIGAAPNGYFMKKAAQFGQGSYLFIQNNRNVEAKTSEFMKRISLPAVSNLQIILDVQLHQQAEVYPKKIPDLHFNEPLQVAIKSQLPITSAQLTGDTASQPWYQQLIIDQQQSSQGISTLWARRKIEDLVDSLLIGADKEQVKSEVISTSINHQILSPYTSFIAVEKTPALFANQQGKIKEKTSQQSMQLQDNLLVTLPQTALGWQLQLLFGLLLIMLAKVIEVFMFKQSK